MSQLTSGSRCRVTRASRIIAAALIAVVSVVATVPRPGDGAFAADKDQKEQRSKRRLEIMKAAIDELNVSLKDAQSDTPPKFAATPLLRYSDETRDFLDASVWRLGEKGRPHALVTIELYKSREGVARLTYEFFSLTPSGLSLDSPRNVRWLPSGTDLKVSAVPDGPAPADSTKTRLLQMRQMARRFAAHEEYRKDKVECRLMPQPIDRYDDAERGIVDGAIFAFANGTNPEIGLLLECGKDEWSYGVLRLSSAALTLDLDGKLVYQQASFTNYKPTAPYTSQWHEVPLPE